jgi:hypothetical protein
MASANQRNRDCRRTKKRSHTEAFTPKHGKIFRIKKQVIKNPSFYCDSHKSHIITPEVKVNNMVIVTQCMGIGDRCSNETDYVSAKVLDGKGQFGHIPIDCIDQNTNYDCFMCHEPPAVYNDFDQFPLHLLTNHFAGYLKSMKCTVCRYVTDDVTDFIKHCRETPRHCQLS